MLPETLPRYEFLPHLITFFLVGWLNKHQQPAIDPLREEKRILHKQIGDMQLRLTDKQRRQLAVKGNAWGRKLLGHVETPRLSWLGITG